MAKKKDYAQDRLLLARYSKTNRTRYEESIDEIRKFVERCMKPNAPRQTVLDEAVRTIIRMTEFKEIAINVKDVDGNYRFLAVSGLKREAEAAMRALAYTPADLKNHEAFPSFRIGRVSQYFFSEMSPYKPGEEKTYNEPQLLGKPRGAADEMKEGDYIDTFLVGPANEQNGWIELASTKTGKLPSRETIIWVELFASSLSTVLSNLPVRTDA